MIALHIVRPALRPYRRALRSDEMDAIVGQLRDAGLLTIGFDADGIETWTLTPEGARRVSSRWATAFNAILDAVESRTWE